MAKTLPQFMQRKLSRKTANITRLTDAYKGQVDALTNDYQTQFTQYQTKRAETMAPYEAAVTQYQADFTGYEQAAAAYKQKLTDYTAKLEDINKNPLENLGAPQTRQYGRGARQVSINGQWYSPTAIPEGYTYENGTLYKKRDAGTFTEKAPSAPNAPVAPTVEEFDSTQFDAKRGELQSNLNRDLGAVKASRVSAVSRKSSRPMLQSAQA
jgi:hypothetical protein